MKILVVDDEPHITHMLRVLFQNRGHEVLTASTGEEALAIVQAESPDVVFLDLNLPGKSGFEVCEAIRAHERFRHLPIFILTAQGQDIDREHGLAVGATEYLTKPFAPSHLVKLIQDLQARGGAPHPSDSTAP